MFVGHCSSGTPVAPRHLKDPKGPLDSKGSTHTRKKTKKKKKKKNNNNTTNTNTNTQQGVAAAALWTRQSGLMHGVTLL